MGGNKQDAVEAQSPHEKAFQAQSPHEKAFQVMDMVRRGYGIAPIPKRDFRIPVRDSSIGQEITPTRPEATSDTVGKFCLSCGSRACRHLQGPRGYFTPREVDIVHTLVNPALMGGKQIAYSLGITEGTLKVYMNRMRQKLGLPTASLRIITLWVIAHAAELGVKVPTQEQFSGMLR